jgi:hypothetical protein
MQPNRTDGTMNSDSVPMPTRGNNEMHDVPAPRTPY